MELWYPGRCMRGRVSDWLGHNTWRGEEEDQCVYPRESRQGSGKACKLVQ